MNGVIPDKPKLVQKLSDYRHTTSNYRVRYSTRQLKRERLWNRMTNEQLLEYYSVHYNRVENYYANPYNVLKELEPIIQSEYRDEDGVLIKPAGALPTRRQLRKINNSLSTGIVTYYGGFSGVLRFLDKSKFPRLGLHLTHDIIELQRRLGEDLEPYLKREYVEKRRSTVSICKDLEVEDSTIYQWLKRFDILARTVSESRLPRVNGAIVEKPSSEQLRQWYIEEEKSAIEIAEVLGLEQFSVVYSWLKQAGIKLRDGTEARLLESGNEGTKPTAKQLLQLYIVEDKSTTDIAKLQHVSPGAVSRWLIEAGIKKPKYNSSNKMQMFFEAHKDMYERGNITQQQLFEIFKKKSSKSRISFGYFSQLINRYGLRRLKATSKDTLSFQEFLETHEEAQQVREILAAHEELVHYLSPEQQEEVLKATAQRVYENLNGQKEQFPPEKLVYPIRKLNVGVVKRPDSNGSMPPLPEVLGRAYRAQIIGEEATEEILGRWLSKNLNLDRLRTLSEAQRVVELQKELVGVSNE